MCFTSESAIVLPRDVLSTSRPPSTLMETMSSSSFSPMVRISAARAAAAPSAAETRRRSQDRFMVIISLHQVGVRPVGAAEDVEEALAVVDLEDERLLALDAHGERLGRLAARLLDLLQEDAVGADAEDERDVGSGREELRRVVDADRRAE